jgi:hypothetical protein
MSCHEHWQVVRQSRQTSSVEDGERWAGGCEGPEHHGAVCGCHPAFVEPSHGVIRCPSTARPSLDLERLCQRRTASCQSMCKCPSIEMATYWHLRLSKSPLILPAKSALHNTFFQLLLQVLRKPRRLDISRSRPITRLDHLLCHFREPSRHGAFLLLLPFSIILHIFPRSSFRR